MLNEKSIIYDFLNEQFFNTKILLENKNNEVKN